MKIEHMSRFYRHYAGNTRLFGYSQYLQKNMNHQLKRFGNKVSDRLKDLQKDFSDQLNTIEDQIQEINVRCNMKLL